MEEKQDIKPEQDDQLPSDIQQQPSVQPQSDIQPQPDVQPQHGINKRRSRWVSSKAGLDYFSQSFGSDKLKFRFEDKLTNYAFALAVAAGTAHILYPSITLLSVVSDVLILVTVVFFITQRLGILSTLTERQVVLCGELIFGFILLSIFASLKIQSLLVSVRQILITTMGGH